MLFRFVRKYFGAYMIIYMWVCFCCMPQEQIQGTAREEEDLRCVVEERPWHAQGTASGTGLAFTGDPHLEGFRITRLASPWRSWLRRCPCYLHHRHDGARHRHVGIHWWRKDFEGGTFWATDLVFWILFKRWERHLADLPETKQPPFLGYIKPLWFEVWRLARSNRKSMAKATHAPWANTRHPRISFHVWPSSWFLGISICCVCVLLPLGWFVDCLMIKTKKTKHNYKTSRP